jgi:hypothetical protein
MCKYSKIYHLRCGCRCFVVSRPCKVSYINCTKCPYNPKEGILARHGIAHRCSFCEEGRLEVQAGKHGSENKYLGLARRLVMKKYEKSSTATNAESAIDKPAEDAPEEHTPKQHYPAEDDPSCKIL